MTDTLLKGFESFRQDAYQGPDALMPQLVAQGQHPEYFIISCIDSRSNPGTIFKPAPGIFLAHKAMGAIVRPYKKGTALAAALQFALIHSDVQNIIILGHTGCSAVEALVNNVEDEEISSFMEIAQEGLKRAKERCGTHGSAPELLRHAEEQILLQSTENLKSYPSVQKKLAENRLSIKSWLFDMEAGALLEYDKEKTSFLNLLQTDPEKQPHA